ncbi:MAG: type VI secretion system ATPase TssH [Nitrosomonas sp.]|nr:type VI secretion system ATPase TssH [Nitrosomonas sp.]
MITNLKSLIDRLNSTCRSAMEGAAGLCLSNTHYEVDIEHVLLKILEQSNTDLHCILQHFEINPSNVQQDLTDALEGLKRGNTRTPVLSPHLPKLYEQAWLEASINFKTTSIRSGHLVLALLSNKELIRVLQNSLNQLNKINIDELRAGFLNITAASAEIQYSESLDSIQQTSTDSTTPKGKLGKTPGLDQYTVNLTERAQQGKIDPVLGRDREIRQMIDILTRRRQNNPILTGEAGVGKTAVVEGLALRIGQGDVPPPLKTVALHMLDLGLLQAGASVKGEFENRLKSVIEEVKRSPHPIILFIDEAHTMIGAGGAAGQNDAANLLKPALARGELRTIAATTWSEYKKYFEKDAALARRFQVVKVDEPSETQAVAMLRGLADMMEHHHNIRILDEAVAEAVRLSSRYLTGRQLPDKAVSVLDTACARVAIGQTAVPAAIEDMRRAITNVETEIRVLKREEASGGDHQDRIKALESDKENKVTELDLLEKRWQQELGLVEKIRAIKTDLEKNQLNPAAQLNQKQQLNELNETLAQLQGDTPLVQVCVDGQVVGEVISAWTGIPLGKMLKDEINTVLSLKPLLEERVIGQTHALEAIAQRIRTARANLEDPGKPKGVFLLVGPSGVGKTETALALADILYGGERNIVTINMSEFQEAHTVATLKGSPPGYVGYGEGGVLTEAVRRKPYSVVLLDEVEKAHPDVLELFFQVFDKGMMDDAEGREIDFKNTVIILTSNVGTATIMDQCLDAEVIPDAVELAEILRPELQRAFKPAFLGRLAVIPYYPIRDEIMHKIISLKLGKIQRRILENHRAEFSYDESLVKAVCSRCTEVDSGARNVDYILTGTLLPEISQSVLAKMAEGEAINQIQVTVDEQGAFLYTIH